jgi:hypothetical protein
VSSFNTLFQNLLERLRKITKNLTQDNLKPGRDLNPGPPEYEAGVIALMEIIYSLYETLLFELSPGT